MFLCNVEKYHILMLNISFTFVQMEPGKLGAGGNSASEGVLANFFNSLLSNKRAGAADRLSAGGVGTGSPAAASNSPGGVAVPSSPIGQKPLASSNDDCK